MDFYDDYDDYLIENDEADYPDEFDYPTEEEERQIEMEEYEYNHGTCPTCGGEWGDGWTMCDCNKIEDYDAMGWWARLLFEIDLWLDIIRLWWAKLTVISLDEFLKLYEDFEDEN